MKGLRVNGIDLEVDRSAETLLSYLRDELGLTGAKPGCGEGACGACTVLLEGKPVLACQTSLGEVIGRSVTTIEGLAVGGRLDPVQRAFIEEGASQCGYCTPAMVLRTKALLVSVAHPDDAAITAALEPNLCRCGCYRRILRAVRRAEALCDRTEQVAVSNHSHQLSQLERPERPWDLSAPGERDYFGLLGEGLVVVWPSPKTPPGMWSSSGGAWLHVSPAGVVTAFVGKVDVGQDNTTAFALLVAEGIGASLDRVRVVQGDTDVCPFDQGTFGSRSMPDTGEVLRRLARAARAALCRLAAQRWCHLAEATLVQDGFVIGQKAVERASFGELVVGRRLLCVVSQEPELAPPVNAGLERSASPRSYRSDVVTGARRFCSDLSEPGMLYGGVLRPPRRGAVLSSFEAAAVEEVVGAQVVDAKGFVGAVAPSRSALRKALGSITAVWDEPRRPLLPDGEIASLLRAHPVAGSGWERAVDEVEGDVEELLATSPIRLRATYTSAYIAHVPLETRAALARWDGGRLTVLVGTQVPFGVRASLARELEVPEQDVRVIVPPTGGAFGGKHAEEVALDASRLARAVRRPVMVHWSRHEEFQFGYFRPMAVIDVEAGVDREGRLQAWDFVDVNAGAAGLGLPYRAEGVRLRYQPSESPFSQGSYRSLAATANNFARESCIDELALGVGVDPLAFRLASLDDPRLATVLLRATEAFGWDAPLEPGTGRGLALGVEKGGRVATCAEVAVASDGAASLTRITTAYECGRVVNRDAVLNQIEGATVMALGGALFEQVDPRAAFGGFGLNDYRVPRFSDVPEISVVLIDRPDLPSAGAGETPMIAVAPAIANAIASATGRRIRELPLLGAQHGRSGG